MPLRQIQRLCVFAGSSPGAHPDYLASAQDLGVALAKRGSELVYGGAHVGLMGALADAALAEGGRVIGVLPLALVAAEVAHEGLSELEIVDSMHERKARMADLSDAFVALPGGLGTFEELLEVMTWAQLGLHAKPCGVLNIAGYFDGLLRLLDHAVEERFLKREQRESLVVAADPKALISALEDAPVPQLPKWLDRPER